MTNAFDLLGLDREDPEIATAVEDFDELADFILMLVKTRKDRKISQKQIAAAMGTTQSVVSSIERIGGNPTIRTLQRYARALDLRVVLAIENAIRTARDDASISALDGGEHAQTRLSQKPRHSRTRLPLTA